jgi:hypothetical protein
LKKLQKQVIPFLQSRIRMLIVIKENEENGISKRALAEIIGVRPTSIELICSHNKVGFKPSILTKDETELIEKQLNDPFNGMRGYKELQQ